MQTVEEVWGSLTYDQKLAATAFVFEKVCEHAHEGGTFRALIYHRLGFNYDAYVLLYGSGGMTISNNFNLSEDDQ